MIHHAPPVYTYANAPPITNTPGFCHQDVNHYVVEAMNRKMKILEDAMRDLRRLNGNQSVRYEELCTFFPDVELPPGYKIPKFEKFDGSGNPFFYLKVYCKKLIGFGSNEGIRIKLFNQILTGKALK